MRLPRRVAALALVLAGCASTLPYTPAQQPAGFPISADYEVVGDRLRVEIDTRGYRVEDVRVLRPDGAALPAQTVEHPSPRGGSGLSVGLGVGGSGGSGSVGIGGGVGIGTAVGGGSRGAGTTLAWFPLADVGPGPWLLLVKVVGVQPVDILLDPSRRYPAIAADPGLAGVGTVRLRLVITPLLIGIATVAGRRWGPGVSGWVAGFPLTSGPVSVFLALEQGPGFAAQAAVGTLLGLAAMAGFCLVYSRVAPRAGWPAGTLACVVTFVGGTLVLAQAALPVGPAFALVCLLLAGIAAAMPRLAAPPGPGTPPPWDLPLRIATATTVVLGLTALASLLGPRLTGFLSPFPVFALVMGVFTHRAQGPAAATRLLRWVVLGSFAFAAFFLAAGLLLERTGLGVTYAAATAAALTVNAGALYIGRRVL